MTGHGVHPMRLYGVDFTSAPCARKPIVVAAGRIGSASGRLDAIVRLDAIEALADWDAFDAWLRRPGPWTAGFDFPFGLPRELLTALNWPHRAQGARSGWQRSIEHVAALPRPQMVEQFRRFCDARPAGGKFAHRACDIPAGSSPSMKWVNPPVAFMLQSGVPRLLAAGLHIPGLHDGDRSRVALEAYPGLLARAIVGRASYKSDDRRKQDSARHAQRERMLSVLQRLPGASASCRAASGALPGRPDDAPANPLPLILQLSKPLRMTCLEDGSGDSLDAVLCLMQAAWGWQRRDERYGMPANVDPLEGWIVAAGEIAC